MNRSTAHTRFQSVPYRVLTRPARGWGYNSIWRAQIAEALAFAFLFAGAGVFFHLASATIEAVRQAL